MYYIKYIILSILEGFTEYIPISSKIHIIILSFILGIKINNFTNFFIENIQLGTIIAFFFLYKKKIKEENLYKKILLSSLPISILGFFFKKKIDYLLNNPILISLSLLIGGIIFLKIEDYIPIFYQKKNITYYNAFIIGLFQTLSIIPGISRSGSSIIGGIIQKINRKKNIEFSFFIGIPSIIGSTIIQNYYYFFNKYQKYTYNFFLKKMLLLLISYLLSFFTSFISINYFIKYLIKNNLKLLGYYRIILGFTLLIISSILEIEKYYKLFFFKPNFNFFFCFCFI